MYLLMIQRIQELARKGYICITLHARHEMDHDRVSTDELLGVLQSPSSEIIEDYPNDPRGHSHLLLGWLTVEDPLHICCAIHEEELIIITVYRPDQAIWQSDWRKRK